MNDAPLPPYLKPKATKLPAGHDDTLDPPEPPTDAAARKSAPFDWAQFDTSKGGDGPPDAPLAPPAVDPAARSVPASTWPRVFDRNRPLRETLAPVPDLDPDIALWPVTILSRWPFAGPPSVGIWPKGWLGVDNTAAVWVCTVGGEPGTWAQVGAGGGGTIPGGGSGMPISDPAGITTAVITPDPIDSANSQLWVKFPSAQSAMAWGRTTDSFPRVVMPSDPQNAGFVYLGNGTYDPYLSGTNFIDLETDAQRGDFIRVASNGLGIGAVLGELLAYGSTPGIPQGIVPGLVGDVVAAKTPSSGFPSWWRCSAFGDASTAQWVEELVIGSTDPITDGHAPHNAGALWQDTSGSGSLWISTGSSVGNWEQIWPLLNDANRVLNVGSTGGTQNLLTTVSLGVGSWKIDASFIWAAVATSNNAGITAVAGTATATFRGQPAGSGSAVAATDLVNGSLTCIADVTVPGTVIIQGLATNGGTWDSAGYTAVKIA